MIRVALGAVLAVLLAQLTSCAGGTVGVSTTAYPDSYWGEPAYGYDLDYFYGPPVIYGGWGPGYFVGPPRWDGHPPGWGGRPPGPVGRPPGAGGNPPGFRPAPPGRPLPSIPSAPRGGGMRGGHPR